MIINTLFSPRLQCQLRSLYSLCLQSQIRSVVSFRRQHGHGNHTQKGGVLSSVHPILYPEGHE
ncbi:hypothetical protein GBAR_LOCUS1872 [Geodia barretti]|uniref:Uncharacterized protein n=1 Tax=Geodia barretti TaxID=519541 RepID=A0AA35QXT4_GEOBA|nr:hypothetical protein GBAR_LOCUS1872 [Geodia barretti]